MLSSRWMRSHWDLRAVSSEGARLLVGNPAYDGLVSVADVTPELDVWDAAAARVLAYPAHRDAQQLGDLGGGEEALASHILGQISIHGRTDIERIE
jgi:hypothetical protein